MRGRERALSEQGPLWGELGRGGEGREGKGERWVAVKMGMGYRTVNDERIVSCSRALLNVRTAADDPFGDS